MRQSAKQFMHLKQNQRALVQGGTNLKAAWAFGYFWRTENQAISIQLPPPHIIP